MFTIKTSKQNKELVTALTNKLSLGAENLIARLAFAYSLSLDRRLDLVAIDDSKGKEYNSKVLFGEYIDYYVAMICVHYGLHKSDKDLSRYIKMHVDDGLQLIIAETGDKNNITGVEFIIDKIERGLKQLM